jgi:hypothetical protein
MKTIEEFCHIHDACSGGRTWATANCSTMQEAWEKAPYPSWVIWIATRQGVLTDRELRLFAVWCARQMQHLLTDPRSINAIDVAERYANGEATDEELAAAWTAVLAAEGAADRAAANAAAWAAARGAAWAAEGAASATARAAARGADSAAQAQWLRENTKPNFA